MTDAHDRSFGSMIGAFIGDSLGSYLEFNMGPQKEQDVIEGMKMPGQGTWGLAPGQITDDSELAMCQLRGLVEGKGTLNLALIARYYGRWLKDGPFDCGFATQNGLRGIDLADPKAADAALSANTLNR